MNSLSRPSVHSFVLLLSPFLSLPFPSLSLSSLSSFSVPRSWTAKNSPRRSFGLRREPPRESRRLRGRQKLGGFARSRKSSREYCSCCCCCTLELEELERELLKQVPPQDKKTTHAGISSKFERSSQGGGAVLWHRNLRHIVGRNKSTRREKRREREIRRFGSR